MSMESTSNMFQEMTPQLDIRFKPNLEFNKKLLQLVEPHPLLYAHSPMRQNHLRIEIWENIAKTMGVSSNYLQAHWKQLRGRYSEFVRKGKQDSPDRIESYMQFLRPHLIVRNRSQPPPMQEESDIEPYSPTMPKIARVESCAHLGYDPGDKDAVFLLSILPHMKVMTGKQRRQFKMGAVTLSAEILKI